MVESSIEVGMSDSAEFGERIEEAVLEVEVDGTI